MIKEKYYSFDVRLSVEGPSYYTPKSKYYNIIANTHKEAYIKLIELIEKYHSFNDIDSIIPNGKKVIEIYE